MESLPNRNDCKNLSKTKAISYIDQLIDLLEKNKLSICWNTIYNLILRIAQTYVDYYHHFIDDVCEHVRKRNLCDLLHYYLICLIESRKNTDKEVLMIYTVLINFSDHSNDFAKLLLKSQILNLVIDNLFLVYLSDVRHSETKKFFNKSLKIINNVTRDPGNIIDYRVTEIMNVLANFIKTNKDDELGLISMLVLSYLVTESEIGQLDQSLGIIKNLIVHIKYTNKNSKRLDGFTLQELVHSLRCISCNDNVKIRIDEEGGIPLLIDILQADNEYVVESVLATIENLCFNEKIKNKLIVEYSIEEVIKPFANKHCENIQKHYNGILWKVQNKAESFHESQIQKKFPQEKYSFDVFLSYAWANKETIREIFQKLKSYNLRVWIDEEQMKGSSIEAMANGIENSRLFILSVSNSYRKSENCRHEAEYAFQIKKPIIPIVVELKYKPSSWLGFIIGTKVYYEFSERRNPEEEIIKLKESIQSNLEDVSQEIANVGAKDSRNKRLRSIENWSCLDVSWWLENCQLGSLKNYFEGINGRLLLTIINIRLSSPEYFNNSLKSEFGMNFLDVVKFHNAIEELYQST